MNHEDHANGGSEAQAERLEDIGVACIFRAMKLRDPELTIEVFAVRCLPIIRMVTSGSLELREIDWEEEREKVRRLMER